MRRSAALRKSDAVRRETAPADVVPLELFRQCQECKQDLPIRSFLPSPHHPGGRVPTCTPCIRARAERDRLERERRHAEAVARAAGAGLKKCRSCKVEKPVGEFSKHRLSRARSLVHPLNAIIRPNVVRALLFRALASMWNRFRSSPSLFNMGIEAIGVGIQKVFGYNQRVAMEMARMLLEADPTRRNQILRRLARRGGPDRFARFADMVDRSANALTEASSSALIADESGAR